MTEDPWLQWSLYWRVEVKEAVTELTDLYLISTPIPYATYPALNVREVHVDIAPWEAPPDALLAMSEMMVALQTPDTGEFFRGILRRLPEDRLRLWREDIFVYRENPASGRLVLQKVPPEPVFVTVSMHGILRPHPSLEVE